MILFLPASQVNNRHGGQYPAAVSANALPRGVKVRLLSQEAGDGNNPYSAHYGSAGSYSYIGFSSNINRKFPEQWLFVGVIGHPSHIQTGQVPYQASTCHGWELNFAGQTYTTHAPTAQRAYSRPTSTLDPLPQNQKTIEYELVLSNGALNLCINKQQNLKVELDNTKTWYLLICCHPSYIHMPRKYSVRPL